MLVPSESTPPVNVKPLRKKRSQYKRMPDEKKRDLIFRVLYLSENVRSVCRDLEFNFSTGRNLIQKYKKTGEYDSQEKVPIQPQGEKAQSTKSADGEGRKCPLGLVMLNEGQVSLVSAKRYKPEEESALTKMHSFFASQSIV